MSYHQPNNSSAGSSSSSRPAKRTRTRGSTACTACRGRRSKCDLIDQLGCHRCKQLGTACSLEGTQSGEPEDQDQHPQPATASGNSTADSAPDVSAVLRRLAALENEIKVLKSRPGGSDSSPINRFDYTLSTQENFTPPTSIPTVGPMEITEPLVERKKSAGGEERDETWYRRWADPESFGLVHRGMKSKGELWLRDPIAEGIITEPQAEAAYQLFKYHFTSVFPHPHLLAIRSTFPAQPFHLSACLYYVTHCPGPLPLFTPAQTAHLKGYLMQNLDAYHRGCRPSLEGIMAAFVLSFLPPGSAADSVDLDPTRMVGLAYAQVRELGQSVYMDRLLALLESGMPICHLEQQLHDARMFMSVINRSAWFAHSRCPWASLPVLVEGAQPKILAYLKRNGLECDLDRHLMLEQDCLGTLFKHSRIWQDLQRVISPSVHEVIRGNHLVRECTHDLDTLLIRIKAIDGLRSRDFLACHVAYCQWWVSVRNVWSIYRLPSPLLGDQTYTAWLEAMTIAAESSVRLLSACLAEGWKLDHWPGAIGRAVLLCFVALSTGIIHYQHNYPSFPLPDVLNISPLLNAIQTVLNKSGTELAGLVSGTNDRLTEYKTQLENLRSFNASQDASQNGLGGFGANQSMFGEANVEMGEFFNLWNGDGGNPEMGDMFGGLDNWWSWPMGNNGGDEPSWGI